MTEGDRIRPCTNDKKIDFFRPFPLPWTAYVVQLSKIALYVGPCGRRGQYRQQYREFPSETSLFHVCQYRKVPARSRRTVRSGRVIERSSASPSTRPWLPCPCPQRTRRHRANCQAVEQSSRTVRAVGLCVDPRPAPRRSPQPTRRARNPRPLARPVWQPFASRPPRLAGNAP